jgi:hypothetical protein
MVRRFYSILLTERPHEIRGAALEDIAIKRDQLGEPPPPPDLSHQGRLESHIVTS